MSLPKKFMLDIISESKEKDQNVTCKIQVEKEQAFHDAATSGNVEKIAELLASSEYVETGNLKVLLDSVKKSLTPLHIAAANGHVKCVEMYIHLGADVNAKHGCDSTALHLAAKNGHYMCLKALLEAGAHINASIYGRPCMEDHNNFKGVYNPCRNFMGVGTTALHLAAKYNHVKCIELLLQFGADCDAIDVNGHTSLHIAARENVKESVLTFLRHSPSRASLFLPSLDTSDTPLHYAVENRMLECVRELVHLGSDVNLMNDYGFTPIHILLNRPKFDVDIKILKLLVLEGFNTDINKPTSRGESPLYLALFRYTDIEIISFLIAYGADINLKNRCPLNMHPSLLEFLLSVPNGHDSCIILSCIMKSMLKLPRLKSLDLCFDLGDIFIDDTIRLVQDATGTSVVVISSEVDIICQRLEEQGMIVNRPRTRYMKFPLQQPFLDIIYERIIEKIQDGCITHVAYTTISSLAFHEDDKDFLLVMKKQLWYEKIASKPPTLLHCCRYSIRKAIGLSNNMRDIKRLPLPEKMLSYLLFHCDK